MLIDNMMAYAEIDEILNLLEDEYAERIPEKIRNFFKEEKMPGYKPEIDTEISGVRIDIWTHFMRGCIIDYVH